VSKKKLTLSVEERLTRRAEAIAEERGTSVSRLVEMFLGVLGDSSDAGRVARQEAGENVSERRGEEEETEGSEEHEFSEWARRWRGAFREPGCSYPDDPSWEERVLAEEIGEKHA